MWSFLLPWRDCFNILGYNNGWSCGSKSPRISLAIHKDPNLSQWTFFFWKTHVDVSFLDSFFMCLGLCADFTSCIFSPLNFLFHVESMVFIMHQWTSIKWKVFSWKKSLKAQLDAKWLLQFLVIYSFYTLFLYKQMIIVLHSGKSTLHWVYSLLI